MKPKFKARELWLFAPFLLIIAGAWYWQRVEQVSGPNARGMFVSDFKVEAAPGYYQEQGLSHKVTVTISHPWPRPKWWGQHSNYQTFINALYYTSLKPNHGKALAPNVLAQGESVTYREGNKEHELPSKFGGGTNDFRFDGINYVSVDYFDLNNVPVKRGALTLHGAYAIAGQPVLGFKRQIRKAGESLVIEPNKDPGARLVSIDASNFFASTPASPAGKPRARETCSFRFVVNDERARSSNGERTHLIVTDVELQDETGKKFVPSRTAGLEQTWDANNPTPANLLGADETDCLVSLNFAPTLKTKGQLTMHGQISADDRWPIPFQVVLPPRVVKTLPPNGIAPFAFPLWRDGKPVMPPAK